MTNKRLDKKKGTKTVYSQWMWGKAHEKVIAILYVAMTWKRSLETFEAV